MTPRYVVTQDMSSCKTHIYTTPDEGDVIELPPVLNLKRLWCFQGALPVGDRKVVRFLRRKVDARSRIRLYSDLRRCTTQGYGVIRYYNYIQDSPAVCGWFEIPGCRSHVGNGQHRGFPRRKP